MSSKADNMVVNMIDSDTMKHIRDLFNEAVPGDEFEVMLFNFNKVFLSMEKYISILKFMNYRAKSQKFTVHEYDTLDVSYTDDDSNNFRATVDRIENINKTIEQLHKYKSHIVFGTLLTKMGAGDNTITAMKKIKDREKVADAADINVRFRLAKESDLTAKELVELKNLPYELGYKILFRLKQRVSFVVEGSEELGNYIKVDVTEVRSHKYLNKLNDSVPNYELEIEFGHNDAKYKKPALLDIMFREISILLKIVQQSNYIIANSTEIRVIGEYARVAGLNGEKIVSLDARKPQSLEIQHVTDMIPNKYAVTDKADGDRYFLIILDGHVYFVSQNLNVKDSGIILDKSLAKYNDTILDGEYIFLPTKNRHLYMAFDCLFVGNKDLRKVGDFMTRIKQAEEVCNACFVFKGQKGFVIADYANLSDKKEFNLDRVVEFHGKQIKDFIDTLNKDIEVNKNLPLVRRKYFIPVMGAKPWEIFRYSVLLWNKYTTDPNVKCPYLLDGLIYQPLIQEYVTNAKESKLLEYKWKPPTKNSIDFYIEFVKDKSTGKILSVYDNSVDEYISNKPYKICNLHVGQRGKHGEEPVLFREADGGYRCHIFMSGENAVDIEGNLLADSTVVEFYYNNNPEVEEHFKWVPIRTRYDKTETVLRYGRGFGNYIDVANKVWRSMINPILMTDFEDLAKGNDDVGKVYYYDTKLNAMRAKISHELIISSAKENVYFQVKTDLAKNMTQFHNWIKSIIIYTHCHPMYEGDRHLAVLDLGIGRGGDIMRYYYTEVAFMVGVDIDYESLISSVDGALSRYNKFTKSKPRFPKMYFVQSDAGALLNYDDQFRALKGMTNDNRLLMEKFFGKEKAKRTMFDRINIQFAVHYMFKNVETWTNFKQNINDYLKPGGYFLASTYDAQRIVELLKTSGSYTQYYTNNKGEKKSLFELVKKFPSFGAGETVGTGNALDFFAAWLFLEGNYQTEYLVDQAFLVEELLKDCDLELTDTGTFDQLMEMHREFFAGYAAYESVEETKNFLLGAGKYYDTRNELNVSFFSNTRLYRYYVFRKKDSAVHRQLVQKGGGEVDVLDTSLFKVANVVDKVTSCCTAIHSVLKTHKLIPVTVSRDEFFGDFGIEVRNDTDVDEAYLGEMSRKLVVYHEDEGGKQKKVMDGLNIFVAEKDCNGNVGYEVISNGGSKKAIILLKEGSGYRPVYRLENQKRLGIFMMNDPMISRMK